MAGMVELFIDAKSRFRFRVVAPEGPFMASASGAPAAETGQSSAYRRRLGFHVTGATEYLRNRDGAVPFESAVSGNPPHRDLAEGSADALLMIGGGGSIAYLNAAAETLFGYRREWLLGRHCRTLLPDRFKRVRKASHRILIPIRGRGKSGPTWSFSVCAGTARSSRWK